MGYITDCSSLFESDFNYHTDISDNEISDGIKELYYQRCIRELDLNDIGEVYPTRGDLDAGTKKNLVSRNRIFKENQLQEEIRNLKNQ